MVVSSCNFGGSSHPVVLRSHWHWKVLVGTLLLLVFGIFPSIDLLTMQHVVGDNSVYVPGSGFSGFWYHLALFQSIPNVYDYDYYCFSSACLSVVLGMLQTPVQPTYEICQDIQQEWLRGSLSRYQIVDKFLHRVLPTDEEVLAPVMSRVHIISTSFERGIEITQPANRSQLVTTLKQTTWIPFLTGRGWLRVDDNPDRRYLDGYFSLPLHPRCRYTAKVPFSWNMYVHSLNPGVGSVQVMKFVAQGTNRTNPFEIDASWNALV